MGPTFSRPPWRAAGLVLLALYLAAGAIYSFVVTPQLRFTDETKYLELSHNLLHGPGYSLDGVHLTAARPPGYPFFLATIEATGGGGSAMRFAQFILLGATVLLVGRLGPGSDRPAGLLIVTVLVALYPVLFYLSGTLYPQTHAGFLFVLALTFLTAPTRGPGLNLATGLAFGLLILVVPTFTLTLIVVLAAAWMLRLIRWRDGFLVLAGASLFIGLWTARNAVEFHQFVPLASNSGANLLIGNCENTVPDGGTGNIDSSRYDREATALGLDEFQRDRYYRNAALAWIENNPGRATLLYFEKAANYFNIYNEYAPSNQAEITPWKQILMAASYLLLLGLLAWRLAESKRFPLTPREKLFLLVYVLSAFTMAIFVTRIRYRLPYDFLVIAVVAAHLERRLRPWLEPTPTKPT